LTEPEGKLVAGGPINKERASVAAIRVSKIRYAPVTPLTTSNIDLGFYTKVTCAEGKVIGGTNNQ
jgi:hypothetical protein